MLTVVAPGASLRNTMKFKVQAPSPLMAVRDCFFMAEIIAPSEV